MKSRILSNQRGQSVVEFAFVFIAMVILFFALAGLSIVGYNWMALQYAATEAARFGSLGKVDAGFASREESIRARVQQITQNLGLENVTVVFTDEDGNDTAGSSSELFRLTISRTLQIQPAVGVMFSLAQVDSEIPSYTIQAATVIRNEPF